jgi:hypothetical protein
MISLVAAALLAAAGATDAASPSSVHTRAAPVDLSGYWDLAFDSRYIPTARLLPGVTPAMLDAHARADAHAVRWCNLVGMPHLMDSGRPLNIRQGTREVIIVTNIMNVEPRHIYLDRTQHISNDVFDPSSTGDSIAHWEGNTLVVDTVGFSSTRGLTAIPGGGYRTDSSHLLERFQLRNGGSILLVSSTWTDPKVFAAPQTYVYRYYRLPEKFDPAPANDCNPFDATRTAFLEGTDSLEQVSHDH